MWCAVGIAGFALGFGLFIVMPPPYKATTTVQITDIPGVLPTDEILTEVALAQSRTVAETAMGALSLPEDPKSVLSFMGRYSVVAPTDQLLQFTVKASSPDDAVARARALAASFLLVRNRQLNSSQQDTTAALDQRIANQKKQLAALDAEIQTVQAKPASAQRQAKLATLQTLQTQEANRLKALQAAAKTYDVSTQVSDQKVTSGSFVLDPAAATPRSKIKYPVLYAGGGLIAGLAIGMGLAIVEALVSTRPRRRFDVARALGAPVRLSVGRIRVSRRAARRAPESAGGRAVQQIVNHLRSAVPSERGTAALAVVAADDPFIAGLAVVSLAMSCVREGKRVVLADLSPGMDAAGLLGCSEPGGILRQAAGHRNLTVAIPEPGSIPPTGPVRRDLSALHSADPEIDRAYHGADVLLTLVTLDPAVGGDHLRSWAREAVVILTAGKTSATRLRTLSELIRLSGTALNSAVVVGADKTDESLGVLPIWEGASDASRADRSEESALSEGPAGQQQGSGEATPARTEVRTGSRTAARTESRRSVELRKDQPRPEARPRPAPREDLTAHASEQQPSGAWPG